MTAAIVIPTLDEEAHIGAILAQCTALPPEMVREIVVTDGGSRDRTRAIVQAAAVADPRVRLLANPRRIQSAGINDAVAGLDPAVTAFVRIDAHARYPDDYVPRVLAELDRTGAAVVATRLRTEGEAPLQRAIAAASNSLAGSGGSAHRQGGHSGWVDHGHHAGFSRAMFERVGGYDVGFVANEDAEFDARVRRAGGGVWLAGSIEAGYLPRRTFRALARQYWRYGVGRAANVLKHREVRLRQLVPPLAVLGMATACLAAPFWPVALLLPAAYVAALLAATALLWTRTRRPSTLLAFPALATMHLSWGGGFVIQLVRHGLHRLAGHGHDGRRSDGTDGAPAKKG